MNNINFFSVGNRPILIRTVRGVPALLLGYSSESHSFEALPHLMNDVNSPDSEAITENKFIAICKSLGVEIPVYEK